MILPGGETAGMLEDLCLASVESDAAFSCLGDYFDCIRQRSGREPQNRAKALVHAWLASNVRADLRLGEAAEAGYWPWDNEAFRNLKEFLPDL